MLRPGFRIQVQRFDLLPQLQQVGPNFTAKEKAPGQRTHTQIGVTARKDLGDASQRVKMRHAAHTNGEPWWVLQERLPPVNADDIRWGVSRIDPQVFIPMFDYLLPDPAAEVLVHFGSQTGALAVAMLPQGTPFKKIFLAVGNVLQRPDGKPGYQVWAGFAAVAEKGG